MNNRNDNSRETAPAAYVPLRVSRLRALDLLRGILALSIMTGHFYITLPPATQFQLRWLHFTPLQFVPAGLVIFFMLSGFVLALPYFNPDFPQAPDYWRFLVKRLCRLYIPFAAILCLTFIFYTVTQTDRQTINDMTFHIKSLTEPGAFTLPMLGRALLMTGTRNDNLLNPATWTLVYEMRVSLIFPLLVLLCRRPWIGVSVMGLCYIFVYLAQNSIGSYTTFPGLTDDYLSTWLTTVYLAPCFMTGIFLVKYRDRILAFLSALSGSRRTVLWILVFVNFSFMPDLDIRQPFTEIGAAVLLMLVLSSERIEKIAQNGIWQWLGRISYSLYMVHLPILFVLRHFFQGTVSLGLLCILCVGISLPVATLTQRFVEIPARKLGWKLINPGNATRQA